MNKLNKHDKETVIQCIQNKMYNNRVQNIQEVRKLPVKKLKYEEWNTFIEKMYENIGIRQDQINLNLALNRND